VINQRLADQPAPARALESVATILERETQSTIRTWFQRVQLEEKLEVSLSYKQGCGHLPQIFGDLVRCLRSYHPLGSKELVSRAAAQHGMIRYKQGCTAAMMVEAPRMFQDNLASIDCSLLLREVMTIADELDSHLSPAMESYIAQSLKDAVPA
jgi:hypothetical protein